MCLRWKKILINTRYRRTQLDESTLKSDDIDKDIDRTFPTNAWFTPERKLRVKNILCTFVEMNPGVAYCQGMCFIIFPLYYIFRKSDYVEMETLYAFHKMIEPIRPIYPLDHTDKAPLEFIDRVSKLILLKIHKRNVPVSEKLFELDIIQYFVVSGLPSLFANWFVLNDVLLLWDRLIAPTSERMYDNVVNFMVDYFLSMKEVILKFELHDILAFLSKRRELKIYK
jgi:hypothetical protein